MNVPFLTRNEDLMACSEHKLSNCCRTHGIFLSQLSKAFQRGYKGEQN